MEYFTLKSEASSTFVEQKSKFISYAKPVHSEDIAREFIEKIKTKHFDAKHNVYAYKIKKNDIHRYSDDGEPSGTAGMPVLEILDRNNISDAVIVVTRYFGGILLGTGGLTRAYSKAAKDAVELSRIVNVHLCTKAQIICDYKYLKAIENSVLKIGAKILDKIFSENISLYVAVPNESFVYLQQAIENISSNRAKLIKIEEIYTDLSSS